MVAQVLPDARQVMHQRNAKLSEVRGRAHAGQHQNLRRADRARAQHYLVAEYLKGFAARLHLHAHRTLALEQDALRGAVCANRQVQAMP